MVHFGWIKLGSVVFYSHLYTGSQPSELVQEVRVALSAVGLFRMLLCNQLPFLVDYTPMC